jgi:hypothetical protein
MTDFNDVKEWATNYSGDCSSYVKDLLSRAIRDRDFSDSAVRSRIILTNLYLAYHKGVHDGWREHSSFISETMSEREKFEQTKKPRDYLLWLNAYTNNQRRKPDELHALCSHGHSVISGLEVRIAELERWGRQVHDALDGRPLPECSDEAPARIEAVLARERRLREALDEAIRWIGGWERPMKRRPEVLRILRAARDDAALVDGEKEDVNTPEGGDPEGFH